jgi:hypothetical protein
MVGVFHLLKLILPVAGMVFLRQNIRNHQIGWRVFQGTTGFDISGCDPGFYLLLIRRNSRMIRAFKMIRQ